MINFFKSVFRGSEPGPYVHSILGFDTAKWHYLGTSEIYFTFEGEKASSTHLHFFVHKETEQREYVYADGKRKNDKFDNHSWVNELAIPWKSGYSDIYKAVAKKPSKYLMDYMASHHGHVWDNDTKWWIKSEAAKYSAAADNQKKTQKIKVEANNNVVSINFGDSSKNSR